MFVAGQGTSSSPWCGGTSQLLRDLLCHLVFLACVDQWQALRSRALRRGQTVKHCPELGEAGHVALFWIPYLDSLVASTQWRSYHQRPPVPAGDGCTTLVLGSDAGICQRPSPTLEGITVHAVGSEIQISTVFELSRRLRLSSLPCRETRRDVTSGGNGLEDVPQ